MLNELTDTHAYYSLDEYTVFSFFTAIRILRSLVKLKLEYGASFCPGVANLTPHTQPNTVWQYASATARRRGVPTQI
jgi:hypothetical protein